MEWAPVTPPQPPHAVMVAAAREALRRDPADARLRLRLAWLLHELASWDDALAVLSPARGQRADRMRGMVLLTAGRAGEAVAAFERAVSCGADVSTLPMAVALARRDGLEAARPLCLALLGRDPDHAQALGVLARHLLENGQAAELRRLCEQLTRRGAGNAQLDACLAAVSPGAGPAPVSVRELAPGAVHNPELAAEILAHPNRIAPGSHVASAGGTRVNHPMVEGAGQLWQLGAALRAAVEDYATGLAAGSPSARSERTGVGPGPVRLNVWSIILGAADFERWHLHPAGSISGVYYVQVPPLPAPPAGELQFGLLDGSPVGPLLRPVVGEVVLFPSSSVHRTVPTGAGQPRISVAFDVVPAAARSGVEPVAGPAQRREPGLVRRRTV